MTRVRKSTPNVFTEYIYIIWINMENLLCEPADLDYWDQVKSKRNVVCIEVECRILSTDWFTYLWNIKISSIWKWIIEIILKKFNKKSKNRIDTDMNIESTEKERKIVDT